MSSFRQLSIRTLMLFVLFAAVGVAGLSSGGVLASLILFGAMILTMGIAIMAALARAELRAWAIGFLIPVTLYASLILISGSSEFDPYSGKLPTSKLLQPVQFLITKVEWVNVTTGEVVQNRVPPTAPTGFGGMSQYGVRETPERTTFMALAHTLLALALGCGGARFGVFLHRRHKAEENAETEPRNPL